jgi:Flp pilus assembly protein TadG
MGIAMVQLKALLRRTGSTPPKRRVAWFFGRFRRNAEGATAVEFGLVALPFFALIFAIIETALGLWTSTVLDTAVTDASRRIYTGQFQQANAAVNPQDMPAKFREELCKSIVALFTCSSIKTDVRVLTSFGASVEPVTKDGAFNPAFGAYQPPGANQIVLVRAALEFPIFLSLLYPNQTNLTNGKRLFVATAAFRTEPFGP